MDFLYYLFNLILQFIIELYNPINSKQYGNRIRHKLKKDQSYKQSIMQKHLQTLSAGVITCIPNINVWRIGLLCGLF